MGYPFNIPEAEVLSGMEVKSLDDMRRAAMVIIESTGVKNVLVKGGHGTGDTMTDLLFSAHGTEQLYSAPKIDARNTHGTGCTLSSAIASFLAMGLLLSDLHKRLQRNYLFFLQRSAGLPFLCTFFLCLRKSFLLHQFFLRNIPAHSLPLRRLSRNR